MLADLARGDHPRDGGKGPVLGRGVELGDVLDVAELVVVLDGVEPGERVPDPRGIGVLRHRRTGLGGIVLAVGLGPADHVVAPADVGLVQQVGQVGPGVDGLVGGPARLARPSGIGGVLGAGLPAVDGGCILGPLRRPGLQGVDAARWIVLLGAVGRPLRDQEQMGRQTPRGVGFEHVVLEHEVLGVGPVVGDVALGVVPHHVGSGRVGTGRVGGIETALPSGLGLADEAVHLAPVHVGDGVDRGVGTSAVHVGMVDVRHLAGAVGRVGHADRRCAVAIGMPSAPG